MSIQELKKYIMNNKNKVIAIDGPSGAGKSTLSKKLQQEFSCVVFHTDDYFLPPHRKTEERLKEPGGNLDYERMEEEIFSNIDQDIITSNPYNCKTNILEVGIPKKRSSIIIIEGVYSMHPQFQKYIDFSIFLQVSRVTQLSRILERSNDFMLQKFIHEWIPLEDAYFSEFSIKNNVDLVIEN